MNIIWTSKVHSKKNGEMGFHFFSFATQDEIKDIEKITRELIENGKVEQFVKEHDKQYEVGGLFLLACISV